MTVGFVNPNVLMTSFDIWFLRASMLVIAASYAGALFFMKLRVQKRPQKIDGLFVLAIVYSGLVLSITFIDKCPHYDWCYDLDLFAVVANGVFHWIICWLYLKASIEMPFLFKLSLYVDDPNTVQSIGRQQWTINWIFWINNVLIALMTITELLVEHFTVDYGLYKTVLLTAVFFEIILFLATITFALLRIYRTIWDMHELSVNKALMMLHLVLFALFAFLFVLEYIIFVGILFGWMDPTQQVRALSVVFILKTAVGVSIYELLLFMIVKIVAPLKSVILKIELDDESEMDEDIDKML